MHLGDQISKRDITENDSFGIVDTVIILMMTLLMMSLLFTVNKIFKVFTLKSLLMSLLMSFKVCISTYLVKLFVFISQK